MSSQDVTFWIILIMFGGMSFILLAALGGFAIAKISDDNEKIRAIALTKVHEQELSDDAELQDSPNDLAKIADPKAIKYLSIPSIAPHYINNLQVIDFFSDTFRVPIVENLVTELSGEINSEIQGGVPQIATSSVGGKDSSKLTKTMKMPDVSVNAMFLQYQKEMILNGQVSLGLEEIDIELTDLQEFETALSELERSFGIKIESNAISDYKVQLKEKAALKTVAKLENPLSWVLVEGRFKITKEAESYKCTFYHLINEYLSKETEHITITTLIPINELAPAIAQNYAQSIGVQIPLRVYGRVWQPINRKEKVWELKIIPMCVY